MRTLEEIGRWFWERRGWNWKRTNEIQRSNLFRDIKHIQDETVLEDKWRLDWLQRNSYAFVLDHSTGKGFIRFSQEYTNDSSDNYDVRRAIDEAMERQSVEKVRREDLHIHPTMVGPTGPPIQTKDGHKHDIPPNSYGVTDTGEELDVQK